MSMKSFSIPATGMPAYNLPASTNIPRPNLPGMSGKSKDLQVKWREVICDPTILTDIIGAGTDDCEYSEELRDLRSELAEHLMTNIQTVLTERQYTALTLYLTGMYTQKEIGEQMGICQTSVHKCIFGNIVYATKPPVRHGGAVHRIRTWAESDAVCIDLLQRIQDCNAGF